MSAKKARQPHDANTEARIKAAARVVFHKKGFAAARTRDIAEEAGINLALLNYYFRSKERLFELVMTETMHDFLQNMAIVFNDEDTTLERKVELITGKYIDLLTDEPEIPLFIVSEIRNNPKVILSRLPFRNILQSVFVNQYQDAVKKGEIKEKNLMHFIMNLVGLVVYPFVASPLLKKIGRLNDKQFDKLMQERRKLIPVWVKAMLKVK